MNFLKLWFAVALTLLGLGGCGMGPAYPPTVQDATGEVDGVYNALSSTVILADQTGELVCAGERISDTEILTAFHCVIAAALPKEAGDLIEESDPYYENVRIEQLKGLDIQYATYEAYIEAGKRGEPKGQVAYVDRADIKNDIAILRTNPQPDAFRVPLRSGPLLIGESVFSVGHPYGLSFSFARGYISNQCRWLQQNLPCFTQVDITIWGGSSGGGLYDTEGHLVGVASRRIGQGYAFFAAPDVIVALVIKH